MRVKAGSKTWEIISINLWDWILVIGLVLAPMTGLRVWKVGPGEVLCLIWGVRFLFDGARLKSHISRFFILFILSMIVGSIIGVMLAPKELRPADLLTWTYLGIIAICVYEGLSKYPLKYINDLIYSFSQVAIIWYVFLFLYSRYVGIYFFGAPLWYSRARFSGGGTNPHQIAVLLCALTFVFLRSILMRKRSVRSAIYLAFSIYLMLQTASSTGVLSIGIGFAVAAYLIVIYFFPTRKVIASIIVTAVLIVIVMIKASTIYRLFYEWVESDSNGLGRLTIYASFPSTFFKSPIFGLGPGVHGLNGYIEYHNTYLEILAATGLVGGLLFCFYSIMLFRKTLKSDWKSIPILVSIYAYGLAGFAMRRLVFWGILVFVLVIVDKSFEDADSRDSKTIKQVD